MIYQRSRVLEENIRYSIVLNFDDPNRRFGLRKLNSVFNLQIFLLFVTGIFALASRIQATRKLHFYKPKYFEFGRLLSGENFDIFLGSLFPHFGQYVIVVLWLISFFVVLLPTLVKFLPFLSPNVAFHGWSIEDYLREFIQPADDNKYPLNSIAQVDVVASKFAWNSFWPSGDDVARLIFYFVFFICLVILFPLNYISTIIFAFIALFLAETFLNVYRWFLGHVDERLVKRREDIKPGGIVMGDQINQRGNFGIGQMSGGEIKGEAKVAGVINEAEQQNSVATAVEIQQLLEQLLQTYPVKTTAEQMVVAAEAIKRIESDPDWKQRVINAAKEGGLAAFEKVLDNPVGALITGAIKGWLEVGGE